MNNSILYKTLSKKIIPHVDTCSLQETKTKFISLINKFNHENRKSRFRVIKKISMIKSKEEIIKYIYNFLLVGYGLKAKK